MSTNSRNSSSVFLFGPTGVGKTRFLTEVFPPGFEVVAVDSIQVYRGLDIGSAKPTAGEQFRVPHHLIDVVPPSESFDVGDFVTLASNAVADIQGRGLVPVLSGGTAFYFQNYVLGLPDTPPSDPQTREQARLKWEAEGEDAFRLSLRAVDPVSEARIQIHDSYRLQRAWEVWLLSGRPLSSFGRVSPPPRGPRFVAGLDRPREDLYRRIEARVDAMLADGLEAEVRGLVAAGFHEASPGMKGIGYAEWFPYFSGEATREEVRDRIVLHSRRYAKRQLTFFRSLPEVRWYDPEKPGLLAADLGDWSLTNAPGWW